MSAESQADRESDLELRTTDIANSSSGLAPSGRPNEQSPVPSKRYIPPPTTDLEANNAYITENSKAVMKS
eukprot:gene41801-51808_t